MRLRSTLPSFARANSRSQVTPLRILLSVVVGALIWSEWLALELKALTWSSPAVSSTAVRVLIVADPQLIGYRDEPKLPGPVTRWDADRYIRRAFSRATAHVKPHLIVFLGDLFDEGFKDDDVLFNMTLSRFKSIFPIEENVQVIYIVGDNDVGGELESVKANRVARFNNFFQSKFDLRVLGLKSLGIIHANIFNGKNEYLTEESTPTALRMVLSHAPILRGYGREARVVETLSPNLILSAHDHRAEYYIRERNSATFEKHAVVVDGSLVDFVVSPNGPIVELQAPTCTYRMGVYNMGFGVVFIEPREDGDQLLVRYQVLWLPGRFPQLALYLVVLICLLMYILIHCRSRRYPFVSEFFRRLRYRFPLFSIPNHRPAP